MKRLISVAYDAEDILDDFQYEVHRIVIKEIRLDKKMVGFFCNNPLLFRIQMARKIHKVNAYLKDLNNKAAGVGLVMTGRSNGGAASSQGIQQHRETNSFPEQNEFTFKDALIVGRREEVSNIIAFLTNSDNQERALVVVAIVGLGGIGKTTLARSVIKQLKEGEMANYFDPVLWVYVSNTYDVNSILRRMVEACEATTTNLSGQEGLIRILRRKLADKRVFLVLDDVWNEDKENSDLLKSCLVNLNLARGSTVIVTTRSAKVASTMEADQYWGLETLSDDDCWSILKDRAFADPNASIASELEEIGKEIAKKCAGLPLVAKVLGSLMRSKNSSNEWRSISENPIWQQSLDNDAKITSVLKLSFDNLESPLKPCFAYCSMLNRGSLIEKDKLIQLWMAQGFLVRVHPSQPIEMEDIGGEYFDTLLKNSLFQDATEDEDGVITTCKMHDYLHELAIEVSKFESWSPDFKEKDVHDEIRHVAQIPTPTLEMMSEKSIARLRSLFSDVPVSSIIFQNSKALRVLKIGEVETEELPDSLGKMKHLRYLDISSTKIKAVPKFISKLYNLQTLRLVGCHNCEGVPTLGHLPNLRSLVITEMHTLKCVKAEFYGPTTTIFPALRTLYIANCVELYLWKDPRELVGEEVVVFPCLEELKFSSCPKLESIRITHGMPSLRQLNISNCDILQRLEVGLGYCTSLRTLSISNCPNLASIPIAQGMPSLRKFRIQFCGGLLSLPSGLQFCTSLQELRIINCSRLVFISPSYLCDHPESTNEADEISTSLGEYLSLQEVCPSLKSIPSNLHQLLICDFCGKFKYLPTSFHRLTGLKSLYIAPLSGLWEDAFHHNSQLENLILGGWSKHRSLPQQFQHCTLLKSLDIYNFEGLEALPEWLGNCTSLQTLRIIDCENLKYLPTMTRLTHLKTLHIQMCPLLKENCNEQTGSEWHKISHIPDVYC